MSTLIKVEIELEDGLVIKPIHSISLTHSILEHSFFEIRCRMDSIEDYAEHLMNKTLNLFGKTIKIDLQKQDGKSQFFFKGIITEITVEKFQGVGGDYLIKGYSPTILLDEGTTYATYDNQTVSQCVKEILKDVPSNIMDSKIDLGANDKNMGYRVQYRESSFNFLKKLSKTYGIWMYYDGKYFHFGEAEDSAPIKLVFGSDISTMNFDVKLVPSKFEYINYNTNSNELFVSNSDDASDNKLDSFSEKARSKSTDLFTKKSREMVSFRPENKSNLDDAVKSVKKRLDGRYLHVSGVTNSAALKIGSIIEIEGPNRAKPNEKDDYGKFRITSLSQHLNLGQNYTCTFQAISSTVAIPPSNIDTSYESCEDQLAKVMDNNDPQKQGRIRVQFMWQDKSLQSPWLDCSQIYAGKDRGFYFVPEKDDIVICGFINNNPNLPYVKGSFYGKEKSIPSGETHAENKRKMIRLNKEFVIEFDENGKVDDKNTVALSLANTDSSGKKQNFISIGKDAETGIQIKSAEFNIIIEGKKISVKSKGDIELTSDGEMNFVSKKGISFKSQGGPIKLDSGSQDTSVSSMNIELKAKADLKAEGTAGVTLKGAKASLSGDTMLELKSSGVATLKGTLVQIN